MARVVQVPVRNIVAIEPASIMSSGREKPLQQSLALMRHVSVANGHWTISTNDVLVNITKLMRIHQLSFAVNRCASHHR